jgi:hypothetical protein
MYEVLRRYSLLSWIRYPLALRVRSQVLVSSPVIVPSWRYLAIGFRQSVSGLGGPTIAATSPSGPGLGAIGSAETLRLASDICAGPLSPSGVPSTDIELPLSRDALGEHTGTSSLSQIVGLNKSRVNTPRGGGSWLDLRIWHQLPCCLIGGYGEAKNHQIFLPTFSPLVSRPSCGSHDTSTLLLLD